MRSNHARVRRPESVARGARPRRRPRADRLRPVCARARRVAARGRARPCARRKRALGARRLSPRSRSARAGEPVPGRRSASSSARWNRAGRRAPRRPRPILDRESRASLTSSSVRRRQGAVKAARPCSSWRGGDDRGGLGAALGIAGTAAMAAETTRWRLRSRTRIFAPVRRATLRSTSREASSATWVSRQEEIDHRREAATTAGTARGE